MQVLRVKDSQGVVSEFPLCLQEGESLSFGRSETCDISLPGEGTLSRTHCHIRCERGRLYITDNASVNGIICNGVTVAEAQLRHGVDFVLGLCHLVVEEREEEPEAVPPLPGEMSVASIPLHEPLPVSAAPHPGSEALPLVAAAPVSSPAASPLPAKRRCVTARKAASRKLLTAPAPAPKKKKEYCPRRIKTADQLHPKKKKKAPRKPAGKKVSWVPESYLPQATSGRELGLPVAFTVQLGVLLPHYPLQAEECMTLTISAAEKCYIAVLQYDAEGNPSLIVPGADRENTAVFPHVLTRFPQPSGADYELVAEAPFGPVRLVLLACTSPCNWKKAYKKALEASGSKPVPGRMESFMISAASETETPPRWSSATLVLLTQG